MVRPVYLPAFHIPNFNYIALMMEAVSTTEASVNIYQSTRRYFPENSHLHNRRREKLKSHRQIFWARHKGMLSKERHNGSCRSNKGEVETEVH
jgi:hypothetical protein